MILSVFLLQETSTGPHKGIVEGTVVNEVSKAPVRKATLILRCGLLIDRVESGSSGNFRFTGRPPGEDCRISAFRDGFQGNEIVVERKVRNGLFIAMVPHSALSGRVLDEDGDPVSEAIVRVEPMTSAARHASRVTGGDVRYTAVVATNDQGEFRVSGLGAAKYRILARAAKPYLRTFERRDTKGNWLGHAGDEDFVPTYHPGSITADKASIVTLAAGEDRGGLDIHLQKSRMVTFSGRVIPPADWKREHIEGFVALNRSGLQSGYHFGSTSIQSNGEFDIHGVTPGSYTLRASLNPEDQDSEHISAFAPVTITSAGVAGAKIAIQRPVAIKGSISFPGTLPKLDRFAVELVYPDSGEGDSPPLVADVDPKTGRFAFERVDIGDYGVRLALSGDRDFYLADVPELGANGRLQVRNPVNLRLVAAANGGRIQGEIEDGYDYAVVMIWPESGPFLIHLVQFAIADKGAYTFSAVKPGTYRLAAFSFFPQSGFGETLESQLKAAVSERVVVLGGGTNTSAPRLKVNEEK